MSKRWFNKLRSSQTMVFSVAVETGPWIYTVDMETRPWCTVEGKK